MTATRTPPPLADEIRDYCLAVDVDADADAGDDAGHDCTFMLPRVAAGNVAAGDAEPDDTEPDASDAEAGNSPRC